MIGTVLKDYMVRLGVQIDTQAFANMQRLLTDIEQMMGATATSIGAQMFKGAGMVVGAIATIDAAIIMNIKKVADMDMQYQLLSQKMHISVDAVKAFKLATDTLGHSIDEIAWNAELQGQYFKLVKQVQDLRNPEDFKAYMREVREVDFAFKQLKLGAKLTMESIAYEILKANEGKLKDLKKLLEDITKNMIQGIPEYARMLSNILGMFLQVTESTARFFIQFWDLLQPIRDGVKQIIAFFSELGGDKLPATIMQATGLLTVLGSIFLISSPIMKGIALFISSLLLIDDYMAFKEGRESMLALIPVWENLERVVHGLTTTMGLLYIIWQHFLALITGETMEKTLFKDMEDFIMFSSRELDAREKERQGKLQENILNKKAWALWEEEQAGKVPPGTTEKFMREQKLGDYGVKKGTRGKLTQEQIEHAYKMAEKYDVPVDMLFAVMQQESGRNPNVGDSPAGARGLMQLMPPTAKALEVDRDDPLQNIEGGAKLLSQLHKKYGNWELALADYNSGAVEKYGGKIPPYDETIRFVQNVMRMYESKTFTPSLTPPVKEETPTPTRKTPYDQQIIDLEKEIAEKGSTKESLEILAQLKKNQKYYVPVPDTTPSSKPPALPSAETLTDTDYIASRWTNTALLDTAKLSYDRLNRATNWGAGLFADAGKYWGGKVAGSFQGGLEQQKSIVNNNTTVNVTLPNVTDGKGFTDYLKRWWKEEQAKETRRARIQVGGGG